MNKQHKSNQFIHPLHCLSKATQFTKAVHKPQLLTHIREGTAGADGVVVAHPALIVWVLPSGQDVLVAGVVWLLIQHPAATLYLNGVAAAEVGVHVRAVRVALIGAALEVSVLIKYDLDPGENRSEAKAQLTTVHNKKFVTYG